MAPPHFFQVSYGHPYGKFNYVIVFFLAVVSFSLIPYSFEYPILYTVIFLLGVLCVFTLSYSLGLEFDMKNNLYRNYTSYFFSKRGQWKSHDNFPYVIEVGKRYQQTMSMRGAIATSQSDYVHEVYLTDSSHLKRIYLKSFEFKKMADEYALKVSKLLNKNYVIYSPKKIKK